MTRLTFKRPEPDKNALHHGSANMVPDSVEDAPASHDLTVKRTLIGLLGDAVSYDIDAHPTSETVDRLAIWSVVGLIFLGVTAYGLDRSELSLFGTATWAVTLIVLSRVIGLRRSLLRSRFLLSLGLLFCALLASVLAPLAFDAVHQTSVAGGGLSAGPGVVDRSAALVEVSKLTGLASAFLVGAILGGKDDRAALLLRAVCMAGGLYALLSLGIFVLDPARDQLAAVIGYESRLAGTLMSANVAAALFAVVAILQIALGQSREWSGTSPASGETSFVLQYGTLILLMTCLVLTASRMTTVAFGLGSLLLAGMTFWTVRRDEFRWRTMRPYLILLVVFVGLALAGQLLMARISNFDGGGSGRARLYSELWSAIQSRPFQGYGLGSFQTVHTAAMTPENFKLLWNVRAGHNAYLQWLVEAGPVGTLLMATIILLVLREIRTGERSRTTMKWAMRGVLCASAVLAIQGLSDFSLQVPAIAILWSVLLGAGVAVATGGRRGQKSDAGAEKPSRSRIRSASVILLAVGSELLALLLLTASSSTTAAIHFPLVLRTGYDLLAYETSGQDRSPARDAALRRAVDGALQQAPFDAYAWMIKASVDRDTPSGLAAFARSYEVAPFDANLFKWRTSFAADVWDRLTPQQRMAVITDIRAERGVFWPLRDWLSDLQRHYSGRPFGLALQLVVSDIDGASPG